MHEDPDDGRNRSELQATLGREKGRGQGRRQRGGEIRVCRELQSGCPERKKVLEGPKIEGPRVGWSRHAEGNARGPGAGHRS